MNQSINQSIKNRNLYSASYKYWTEAINNVTIEEKAIDTGVALKQNVY